MLVGSLSYIFGNSMELDKESFNALLGPLTSEVLKNRDEVNQGRKMPLSGMYYYLKWNEGYDEYAYSFLELAFPFFELPSNEIMSYLQNVNLDHVNVMLAQCSKSPNNTPLRAHVAYGFLLSETILPQDVDKNELTGQPKKFNDEFLKKDKIDPKQHNRLIAESLVLRYCCKHNDCISFKK